MKYGIFVKTSDWKKMEIESDEPLTEDERNDIESMGEEGIPERFSIKEGESGGLYPETVEISNL